MANAMCIYPPIYPPVSVSTYLSLRRGIFVSISEHVCLSIYQSIRLHIYRLIYLRTSSQRVHLMAITNVQKDHKIETLNPHVNAL